nr:trefoil factor 1-like [Anolis sagrei ordinatus]
MNFKWLCILSLVFIVGFSTLAEARFRVPPRRPQPPRRPRPSRGSCNVNPKSREDCGWPGITESECRSRGCCFNKETPNTKWCFYSQ